MQAGFNFTLKFRKMNDSSSHNQIRATEPCSGPPCGDRIRELRCCYRHIEVWKACVLAYRLCCRFRPGPNANQYQKEPQMARKSGIKKPQICQAGSAVTFEGSCTTGAEQLTRSFLFICRSSQFLKKNLQKIDHPSYSDCSERAPWALITGVGPLNFYSLFYYLEQNSFRPGKARSTPNIFHHD